MTRADQPEIPYTMVDAAADAGVTTDAHMPPGAPGPSDLARRSLLGQALRDTFVSRGARVGLVWIGILAFFGVFSPLLANSHPILLKLRNEPTQYPLFRSLSAIDVNLVLYFIYAVVILARKGMTAPQKLGFLLWPLVPLVVVLGLATWGRGLVTLETYGKWPSRPLTPVGTAQWWEGVLTLIPALAAVGGAVFGTVKVFTSVRTTRFLWLLLWGLAGIVIYWTTRTWGAQFRAMVGNLWWLAVNLTISAFALCVLAGAAVVSWSFIRSSVAFPFVLGLSHAASFLMIVVSFTVSAPPNIVYERFRELEQQGQVERIVRTIIPYSPNDRLRDRPEETLKPPSTTHWLGTTEFGEDMLSRMLYACRIALAIGIIATSIAVAIGIVVGGLMGYFAGTVDLFGMRILEIIEAIPKIILLLIVTVSFGRSLYLMMVVIGLVSWTHDARFIRAEFLKLRTLDFVQAAIATGLSRWSIIFRHMLPNGVSPVLVSASFGVAGAILLESVLSFLGLGLGPDDPSWGQMLEQARKGGTGFNWWIATFPGLAIFLTVFSYILIGESMRDALDPKLQKRD